MFRSIVKYTLWACTQPVLYFGLALIAVVWLTVRMQIHTEREAMAKDTVNDTLTIARIFEQNVIRFASEIDLTIKYLRQSHDRDGYNSTWTTLLNESYTTSDQTLQLSVTNAEGIMIANSLNMQSPRLLDLSDREHVRIHSNRPDDELFISKPIIGRVSGKWSIQLTRKYTSPEGRFGGVIVASLDPSTFSKSYEKANLTSGSGLMLVGHDGLIRAGVGIYENFIGRNISDQRSFLAFTKSREGTFFEDSGDDTNRRVIAFREVKGYPLMVMVASPELKSEGLWLKNRDRYHLMASILTFMIAAAVVRVMQSSHRYNKARQDLAQSEACSKQKSLELELTLSHMNQGILMVDGSGNVVVINQRCHALFGLPDDFLNERRTYAQLIDILIENGEYNHGLSYVDPSTLDYIKNSPANAIVPHYERTRPDGTILDVTTVALPAGGFVRTISDITQRRHQDLQIAKLARQDHLTELGNRVLLYEKLDRAFDNIDQQRQFAVHVIDLDRFKPINDTFGHPIGDKLLRAVADRLRLNLRPSDVIARLGGDEFAVIEFENVSKASSAIVAKRLCAALSDPYDIDGHKLEISASIGIAFAPRDGKTPQDILKAADLALYAAKADGRSTYRFHNEEMEVYAQTKGALESGLRQALSLDQLELYYQPIADIRTRRITCYEALIRWNDPLRGRISPVDFISIAEEAGLIVPIGAWVLRRACMDMAQLPDPIQVAVNLSAVQFRDPTLLPTVRSALRASGLSPKRLKIEITETTLMQKDRITLKQLQLLRQMGIGISMDDFGTGYSSLSYLHTYPIDQIKIDQSFVRRLGEDKSATAIVAAIATLAKSLGMSTIAEGVETERQLLMLAELGLNEAQGYYFSQPKPAAEILVPHALSLMQAAEEKRAGIPPITPQRVNENMSA